MAGTRKSWIDFGIFWRDWNNLSLLLDSSPFFFEGGYTNYKTFFNKPPPMRSFCSFGCPPGWCGCDALGALWLLWRRSETRFTTTRVSTFWEFPKGIFWADSKRWKIFVEFCILLGSNKKWSWFLKLDVNTTLRWFGGGFRTDGQLVIKTIYFQNFHVDWPFRFHLSLRSFNERKGGFWTCTSAIGVAS